MVVIRVLFLIFSLGLINAFVLSWGIVDISQLYQIPYLKEFTLWNIMGLTILKGVLEGNTKVEMEKRKAEVERSDISEDKLTLTIIFYFVARMGMIVISVTVAHLIYWIYS